MAEYNPYRDNPKRTPCEAMIYDQGYERALMEMGDYIEQQHKILAEDLGTRLAILDGWVDALKKGEKPSV